MGVGFLDFIDSIEAKVRGNKEEFRETRYEFDDDEKEVALDLDEVQGSDQEFDMEDTLMDEEQEDEEEDEEEDEDEEESNQKISDESSIEEDMNASDMSREYQDPNSDNDGEDE